MSALNQAWVASIRVGNQTAKQLLQFLASHNFSRPGFEFKIQTLADQLEVTPRSIQNAFKLLKEKNLLIKEARFNEQGRQLSNQLHLNIPQEFVDNFFNQGEDSSKNPQKEGERASSLGVKLRQGEGEAVSPLLNNKLNININKKDKDIVAQTKKPFSQPPRTRISHNYIPLKEHAQIAREYDLNLNKEVDKFIDHYEACGIPMLDWDAAFRKWLRKTQEFGVKSQAPEKVTAASYAIRKMNELRMRSYGNI